jgi:hypothetical protein
MLAYAFLGLSSILGVSNARGAVEIERVENGTLHFKAGEGEARPEPLKTDLVDIQPLGAISTQGGPPSFLVAADPCKTCGQDRSIYLIRPGFGRLSTFVYPGRIIDSKTKMVLVESRAFFGKCLASKKGDVYVAFQKERIPKKRRTSLNESVFVAEIDNGKLEEKLIDRRGPRMDYTLKRVRAKECFEIDGRNRMTKGLGKLKHVDPNEEDEEDDEEENKPAEPGPDSPPGA